MAESKSNIAGPIMTAQQVPIKVNEVLKILKTIGHERCINVMPNRPKGGEVYVFKPLEDDARHDWREDGYMWKNQGTTRLPRKNPTMQKKYFYAINEDGRSDVKNRKDCFYQEPGDDPQYLTLIHYLGNLGRQVAVKEQPSLKAETVTDIKQTASGTTVLEEIAAESLSELNRIIQLHVGGEQQSGTIMISPLNVEPDTEIEGSQMSKAREMTPNTQEPGAVNTHVNNTQENAEDEVDNTNNDTGTASTITGVADPSQSKPDSLQCDPPDLSAAMATMKAALAANPTDKPMMEMFSRLMDSMATDNREVEFTLVVSDKKSGESSMIGTDEAKDLVSKSPQVQNRLRGKRRMTDETDTSDEPLPKMIRSKMCETTKSDEKAESAKEQGRANETPGLNAESNDNLDISDDKLTDKADGVSKIRTPSKCDDKLENVKKRRRSEEAQETESQNNLDIANEKQTDTKVCRKSERRKARMKCTSDENKTRKEKETPAKVSKVVAKENESVKPESGLRCSSRTRKADTPNWRDILSGRKSFVTGDKKLESSDKSNKFTNKNNNNTLNVTKTVGGSIANENLRNIAKLMKRGLSDENELEFCSMEDTNEEIRSKHVRVHTKTAVKNPGQTERFDEKPESIIMRAEKACTVFVHKLDDDSGSSDKRKNKSLAVADKSKENTKQSVNKVKQSEPVEVLTIASTHKHNLSNSVNSGVGNQENRSTKMSVAENDLNNETEQKSAQTVNHVTSSRPRRRISLNKKYEGFETDSPIIRHTQANKSHQTTPRAKISASGTNDSIEETNSEPSSIKHLKNRSKPNFIKTNPLKTKAFGKDTGSSHSTSIKIPSQSNINKPKKKIKKKGNRHILSQSYDDDDVVDEEDILEWKGYGNIKHCRPKGSGFVKFDLVDVITVPVKDLGKEFSPDNLPEPRRTESSSRSSSRISYNFICESCGNKFCHEYLLEQHMKVMHQHREIVKSEIKEVLVKDGRGRKPKARVEGVDSKVEKDEQAEPMNADEEEDNKYFDAACIDDDLDPNWGDHSEDEPLISDGDSSVSEYMSDCGSDGTDLKGSAKRKIKQRARRMKAPHKCPLCVERYAYRSDLENHTLVMHNQELSDVESQLQGVDHVKREPEIGLECTVCHASFSTRSKFSQHKRTMHKVDYGTFNHFGYLIVNEQYRCEICQVDFESMDKYLDHRPGHLKLPFLCRQCGHGFQENEQYIQHVQSGCDVTTMHLPCGLCELTFQSCDARRKHVYTLHPKTTEFFCHHCGKCFDGMEELRKHFPVHLKDKIFRCDFCDKSFIEKRALLDHRDLHRSTKTFACSECDKFYISQKSLERHRATHYKDKSVKHKCSVCDKTFSYKSDQIKHEQIHLKNEFEGTSDSDKCNICKKSFTTRERLMKHLQHHNEEKTEHKCQFCEATFPIVRDLWAHKKDVHRSIVKAKKKQKTWICETCGFSTLYKGRLKRHLEIHNVEKVFQCEFCTRKFQTYSSLSTHKILHRGKIRKGAIQFHVCRWDGCGKRYLKKAVMKRHLASHLFRLRKGLDVCDCVDCQQSRFDATKTIPTDGTGQLALGESAPSLTNLLNQPVVETAIPVEPGSVINAPSEPQDIQPSVATNPDSVTQITPITSDPQTESLEPSVESNPDSVTQITPITSDPQTESLEPSVESNPDSVTQIAPITPELQTESLDILQTAISQIEDKTEQIADESGSHVNAGNNASWPSEVDGPLVDTNSKSTGTEDVETNNDNASEDKAGSNVPTLGDDGEGENENYFECSLCDAQFPTKCQVLDHSNTEHYDYRYPTCSDCGKSFVDQKNLLEHATVHTGEKPYECEVCHKTFRTKSSCRQHCFIHAENKPYVCSYCGHGFTQKGYFDLHIRRHTGDRPFECDVCHKAFVSKEMLKRHYYVHSGGKPYICDECGKRFVDSTALTSHRRTHNDDRPYGCERCDKAFFTNAKLTRHLKMVHGLEMDMISDYVGTKVGAGLGWRKKSKLYKRDEKPLRTQIVYIDEHGNVLSRVDDDEYSDGEADVDYDDEKLVEVENDMQINCVEELPADNEHANVGAVPDPDNTIVNTDNNNTDLVLTDQSFEVVTRRDARGQLQVDTISVPDHTPIPTPTLVSIPAANSDVSNIQIIDGNIVQSQNYAYIAQEEEQPAQHLQLITQALASHGVGDSQIQVVEGEQIQTTADGNVIYTQQETVAGDNISINIGEDGTVNMADINALRNMYDNQPIIIYLENE